MIIEIILQIGGGVFGAYLVLLTIGAIIRKLGVISKNPACYLIGHSVRVGSSDTRVYQDGWDYINRRPKCIELLWTCTRKGCPKRFRSKP